jgi:hypothetical protein
MTKNKNIPQWQKSVFDNSIKSPNIENVKTKPISTSIVKKWKKIFLIKIVKKSKLKTLNYLKIKEKNLELKKN